MANSALTFLEVELSLTLDKQTLNSAQSISEIYEQEKEKMSEAAKKIIFNKFIRFRS